MHRMAFGLLTILSLILLLVSCSSSNSPITAFDEPEKAVSYGGSNSHGLWGFWQFVADPEAQTLEYYQLRISEFHLNVLPFLEPPPLLNLTLESDVTFDIANNTLEVDIGLTHPFLGLNEFAGFDVKGIVISRADLMDATPTVQWEMPGPTTLRLVNADGYTRMWNPVEFPYVLENELFCYKDGLLGAPDSFGNYDAQLNGYKYYCDGLLPGDPVTAMDFSQRGVFGPGTKNIRTFVISTPQGLIFNYAVDASWEFPDGVSPWTYPDDYPITANSPEAYFIDCESDGLMFSEDGGSIMNLTITVYDHQPGSIQDVRFEAKDLYIETPPVVAYWTAAWQYSTVYSDVYTVHIDNKNGVAAGTYPGLIIAIDVEENNNLVPSIPQPHYEAYKLIDIVVTPKPGVSVTLKEDALLKGAPYFNESFQYTTVHLDSPPGEPEWVEYWEPNGPWQFSYVYTDILTLESIPTTDAEVSGFVGSYPTDITHFWKGSFTFGPNSLQPYLGEEHDTVTNNRLVYGITEPTLLGGTYIFNDVSNVNVPMEFQYPYYYATNFTTSGCCYVHPSPPVPIEIFELIWQVRGIGEGPLTLVWGGATYDALLVRHDLTVELGDTEFAWAVIYEWLDDDGLPLAYIAAGEFPGELNNFHHDTGIIYGESDYMILEGY